MSGVQQQRRVGIDAQTAHLEEVGLGTGGGRSERGRHTTTVAGIAAAAEVAPRTVPPYFRSEQDIALGRFTESMDQLTARLRDREPHDTAVEILDRWLRTEGQDDETNRLEHRMFAANRELRASRMTATLDVTVKAFAEELGAAPDGIGPRIATTAVFLGGGMPTLKGPGRDAGSTQARSQAHGVPGPASSSSQLPAGQRPRHPAAAIARRRYSGRTGAAISSSSPGNGLSGRCLRYTVSTNDTGAHFDGCSSI